MNPIVRSLLETDLYKFTMWQALLHRHPDAQTEYAFVCRNQPSYPLADLRDEVERELDHLCSMSFADDELDFLRGLRFISSDFVDFLTVFRFQRKFIANNRCTMERSQWQRARCEPCAMCRALRKNAVARSKFAWWSIHARHCFDRN